MMLITNKLCDTMQFIMTLTGYKEIITDITVFAEKGTPTQNNLKTKN